MKSSKPAAPAPAAPAVPAEMQAQVEKLTRENAELTTQLASRTSALAVLRGKYDAEVPQLSAQLRETKERLTSLEAERTRHAEAGEIVGLTDAERELAGKPLLDVMLKTARQVVASEFDTRIKPLNARMDVFQRQTEAEFQAALDSIPNFRVQNNDPKFMDWLKDVDPATGNLRNDLLQQSVNLQQGLRCQEIFAAFREGREIGASAPAKPASPDPGAGGADAAHKLDEGANAKIYTRADISAFYDEKRRGLWKSRDAEAHALETDMLLAGREGRVRG